MKQNETIGLIPAAGFATRLSPLPFSKEIYPIGLSKDDINGKSRTKVVLSYLLENMKKAGIEKSYVIIRDGKWDIPGYYLTGRNLNINLAYLVTESTEGVPFTIDRAYPFVKNKRIVFGFPDILFSPSKAYQTLLEKQEDTKADLILGLFKTDNPEKMDMVDTDELGNVTNINIKPEETYQEYTWIIAVWTPGFSRFIHEYINSINVKTRSEDNKELYLGEIIQNAVDNDLEVKSVKFTNGTCVDIGTVGGIKKATSFISSRE